MERNAASTTILPCMGTERDDVRQSERHMHAKGSNLIGDAAYEERATMFGRSLNRDNRTDKELLDEALKTAAGADVIASRTRRIFQK